MKRMFKNHDGTICVRWDAMTWLFTDEQEARQFYRALIRG